MENLRNIKHYYGELTSFLITQQNKNRLDNLEQAFIRQLNDLIQFWQNIIKDFENITKEELEKILENNEELKKELNEVLEKSMGFRPPPNSLLLHLLHIRKIAAKLKGNEAVNYLHFDFFKKYNTEVNENWIRERKSTILTRVSNFEKRLAKAVEVLKQKLINELWKLHGKRIA